MLSSGTGLFALQVEIGDEWFRFPGVCLQWWSERGVCRLSCRVGLLGRLAGTRRSNQITVGFNSGWKISENLAEVESCGREVHAAACVVGQAV